MRASACLLHHGFVKSLQAAVVQELLIAELITYLVQYLTWTVTFCSNDAQDEVPNTQTVLCPWRTVWERYECTSHKSVRMRRVLSIACSPDLWVSRCGVCLRLQGITSALNHVAPSLECAQCSHPAIFLTHKLSEGLTQRLDTHCRRTCCFWGPIRAVSGKLS